MVKGFTWTYNNPTKPVYYVTYTDTQSSSGLDHQARTNVYLIGVRLQVLHIYNLHRKTDESRVIPSHLHSSLSVPSPPVEFKDLLH